jgi:hypothetical protein
MEKRMPTPSEMLEDLVRSLQQTLTQLHDDADLSSGTAQGRLDLIMNDELHENGRTSLADENFEELTLAIEEGGQAKGARHAVDQILHMFDEWKKRCKA